MVVQGLAGGLRPPGPPVSAQHWVELLEHFIYYFCKTKSARSCKDTVCRGAVDYIVQRSDFGLWLGVPLAAGAARLAQRGVRRVLSSGVGSIS